MRERVIPIDDLAGTLAAARDEGKKIVLCHGVFDLLHPGHIRHLIAARKNGDMLVVTITPDKFVNKGPGRPIFNEQLRAEVVAALDCVNFVAINEWPSAVKTIEKLKPHVYVKGNDYQDASKDVTGGISEEQKAIERVGGKICFTNEVTYSSSSIANNYLDIYPDATADFLRGMRERVNSESLQSIIEQVAGKRVLVIGDTIIDEYHYCAPLGKSPKGDVINTKYLSEERFAGGVLAAANHVASICDSVDLVTVLGVSNNHQSYIEKNLKKNVHPKFFHYEGMPTVVKRRFVEPSYMRKLFEISFIEEAVPDFGENDLYLYLENCISDYDIVLVADFGHGVMNPTVVDMVCKKAKFLSVNAQTNSANMGYNLITKYPRADYVCIDEPEVRLAFQDRTSPVECLIKKLASTLETENVTITCGNRGCVVYNKNDGINSIPALTSSVIDTIGAGDAFLAISTPCVAVGMNMEQVGFIGNAAGAIHVNTVGNRTTVEKVPLLKFITTLLK